MQVFQAKPNNTYIFYCEPFSCVYTFSYVYLKCELSLEICFNDSEKLDFRIETSFIE